LPAVGIGGGIPAAQEAQDACSISQVSPTWLGRDRPPWRSLGWRGAHCGAGPALVKAWQGYPQ